WLRWSSYVALGVLLGAVTALADFYRPELRVWASGAWAAQAGGGESAKAKAPPRFEVKPPKGAPNIVIVLLDDIGFAHSSAFGGPIHMPNAEKLAKKGLKYNRFHTCALCSPTRMSLLTGRNHHSCNTGSVMETATAFPGNTGVRPNSV